MPMLLPVVGAAVKYYGQKQAENGAASASAAGLAKQVADRQQAMGVVDANTKSVASDTPAARTGQAQQDYMDVLRNGAANTKASYPTVPGADPRYADAVANASKGATDFETARANLMAGIRGAQRMRGDEGLKAADEATTLTGIGQNAGTDKAITDLNVQKASQVNPAWGLAGDLIGNSAAAFGGGGDAPTDYVDPVTGVSTGFSNPGGMDTTGMSYLQNPPPLDLSKLSNLFGATGQ